jgi:hypothetical protein
MTGEHIAGRTICIYCRGDYGIETYFKLKGMGIRVDCFGDIDEKKQGYVVDNVFCFDYKKIAEMDKEKTCIVVALKNPESLANSFRDIGFQTVYTYKDILTQVEAKKKEYHEPLSNASTIYKIKKQLEQMRQEEADNSVAVKEINQMIYDCNKRK